MENKGKVTGKIKKIMSYWSTPPEGRYLTYKEMGAYSVGGMGVNFLVCIIFTFISAQMIPYIYQIGALHGTYIVIASTVVNLSIQPLLAKLIDNTQTKWGKIKPLFAITLPIAVIVTILATWAPQGLDEKTRIIYAYLTCIPAIFFASTVLQWLYTTLSAFLTPNSQERTDMLAPVGIIFSFAPTVLGVVEGPIRKHFIENGEEFMAFRVIGLVMSILALLLSLLIIFFTKERTYVLQEQSKKIGLVEGVKLVIKNKPFMVMQLASIFGILRAFFFSQMGFVAMLKYSQIYGEGGEIRSGLSLLVGFGATPAMILAPILARKFEKKTLIVVSQIIAIVPLVAILFAGGFDALPIGKVSIIILTVAGFLNSFAAGIGVVLNPAMMAEQYDYQQHITGHRLEGFMNAVSSWTFGIGASLITLIPTLVQTSIGFQQGADAFQTNLAYLPENMAISNSWFNAATIFTIVCTILWGIIMLVFYKLNKKEHAVAMEDLEERSVGNTFDNDPTLVMTAKESE